MDQHHVGEFTHLAYRWFRRRFLGVVSIGINKYEETTTPILRIRLTAAGCRLDSATLFL